MDSPGGRHSPAGHHSMVSKRHPRHAARSARCRARGSDRRAAAGAPSHDHRRAGQSALSIPGPLDTEPQYLGPVIFHRATGQRGRRALHERAVGDPLGAPRRRGAFPPHRRRSRDIRRHHHRDRRSRGSESVLSRGQHGNGRGHSVAARRRHVAGAQSAHPQVRRAAVPLACRAGIIGRPGDQSDRWHRGFHRRGAGQGHAPAGRRHPRGGGGTQAVAR